MDKNNSSTPVLSPTVELRGMTLEQFNHLMYWFNDATSFDDFMEELCFLKGNLLLLWNQVKKNKDFIDRFCLEDEDILEHIALLSQFAKPWEDAQPDIE